MSYRITPAIMSGGAGTRLWPLSTEEKPKQFHALMGERSLFAETAHRVSGVAGDLLFAEPIALCGDKHVAPVRAAMAELGAKAAAIVVEPKARNTAAVAASAAAVSQELHGDTLVLLLPADHVVTDVNAFHAIVSRAAPFAQDRIVTFGITPSHPATGYGYIKRGAALGDGVFAIDTFKEKPDVPTAQGYLNDGGYSWNSGMFLFNPATLLDEFGENEAIRDHALASLASAKRHGDEIRLGAEYSSAPSLPLDIAVMERTSRAAVAPCDIGWADIGSWAEVLRLAPRNADGFAILGAAANVDTGKMRESGVKTAVQEGDDLVVIAAPGGLLIAPRACRHDPNALHALVKTIA